eukprot:scaffold1421_cov255-Pinguiococcus_pyrenoidosus.AAC.5
MLMPSFHGETLLRWRDSPAVQSSPVQSSPVQSSPVQSSPVRSSPVQSNLQAPLQFQVQGFRWEPNRQRRTARSAAIPDISHLVLTLQNSVRKDINGFFGCSLSRHLPRTAPWRARSSTCTRRTPTRTPSSASCGAEECWVCCWRAAQKCWWERSHADACATTADACAHAPAERFGEASEAFGRCRAPWRSDWAPAARRRAASSAPRAAPRDSAWRMRCRSPQWRLPPAWAALGRPG